MRKTFPLNYRLLGFWKFKTNFIANIYNNVELINGDDLLRFSRVRCKYVFNHNSFQNRGYAIKFYSHPFDSKTTFSHMILKYIKSFPEYSCKFVSPLPNVYDNRNVIEQLQSVVIHSIPPEQEDVIMLFSLYMQSSRSTLNSVLLRSNDLKKLQAKFESSIPELSDDHLLQLAASLYKLRHLRWNLFNSLSSDVYDECLKRVVDSIDSVQSILKYFIISLELYGDSVYRRKGYNVFIKCFENCIHEATPSQIVLIMHFVGLTKKQNDYASLLWSCISFLSPKVQTISFIDAGIAAAAVYKMKMKLVKSSSFVRNISEKLNERLVGSLNKDVASLNSLDRNSWISILKNLKNCDYYNTDLLNNLKSFIIKCDLSAYDPQFICNNLSYFSNSNYYDANLFTKLEINFFQFMVSNEPLIRLKDISRAIWAFSKVNHPCKLSNLNLILNSLCEISKTADVLLGTKHFVDSLLALAVYDIYDENIGRTIFHDDFTSVMKDDNKGRPLSRLFLLNHIYKTVFPELHFPLPNIDTNVLPQRTISDELNFRPSLKQIKNALDWLNHQCGSEILQLKFLVPHLHHASLVICDEISSNSPSSQVGLRVLSNLKPFLNCKIFIDINDSHIAVNGVDNIMGLETLKRNILRRQGWNIKVITEKDISNQNNDITATAAFLIETLTSDN